MSLSKTCIECNTKTATYMCSNCCEAVYCSEQCQIQNWTLKNHALICGRDNKKKQRTDPDPNPTVQRDLGVEMLRQLIQLGIPDAIATIARMLSHAELNTMLQSENGAFLMENNRGTNVFWYTRIQMQLLGANLGDFDDAVNYRMELYRLLAVDSVSRARNRQHIFIHPVLGVFSIIPDYIQELDGRHITLINPIGLNHPPETQEFFQDLVDQLRQRGARESFVDFSMMSRMGYYLNMDDLIWLFTYMFTHGFVLDQEWNNL